MLTMAKSGQQRRARGPRKARAFLAGLFLLAPLLASGATDLTIQNRTYPSGEVATETATNTITASTDVTVSDGAHITYVAGTRVTLSPGFHADTGAELHIFVGDSDSDGMPDSWEIAIFGSTNQTAAGDPDGDELDNITEFYLGTDPEAGTANSGSISVNIHRPQN